MTEFAGLDWQDNGTATLSGALLTLKERLDALFAGWAAEWGATVCEFPPLIKAAHLDRLGFFQSFPHLASFAVTLEDDRENLASFAARNEGTGDGLRMTRTAPVTEVLTPAACYHVYPLVEGARLSAPAYYTTVSRCFRRENRYVPLQRQWCFTMREIVCLGTQDEVRAFVARQRARIDAWVQSAGLPVRWVSAIDPFFDPANNPRYLAEKLSPVKTELLFGGLAIGSCNFHRNFFGESYGILRDGEPACSGCVAFGLERWIHAVLTHFGEDPAGWPLSS